MPGRRGTLTGLRVQAVARRHLKGFVRPLAGGEDSRHRRSLSKSSGGGCRVRPLREAPYPGNRLHRLDTAKVVQYFAMGTHDCECHGTCDHFAALNVASCKVITDIRHTHTSSDFMTILNKGDANGPEELDVRVLLDNLSTHKAPTVQTWLLRNRRFRFRSRSRFALTHDS